MNPVKALNVVSSWMNRTIDAATEYLVENWVAIGCLLIVVYYFRSQYLTGGYRLPSSGVEGSKKSLSAKEEMLRVRERQQEIANERAKQAPIERKQKEEEERKKRKDDAALRKAENSKQRLGDATSGMNNDTTTSRARSSGRNPLQPFASNTSSYRPPRRSANA